VRCVFNLGHQRDTSPVSRAFCPSQRCARFSCLQSSHCYSRNHQLVERLRCGRENARIKLGEHLLRIRELTDKKESPYFKVTGVAGVQSVSMFFEGDARHVEHFRGPSQIAGGERDFSFGHDASCAGGGFFGTEATRSFPQKLLRTCELA
jgi:hypothetical protein